MRKLTSILFSIVETKQSLTRNRVYVKKVCSS